MGQPIVVIEKPSIANPGMVRFETNRAITGMGHERYVAGTEVRGDRPPDELARRMLARGGIAAVHINGSVVTVDLEKGHDSDGLKAIIEDLYIFYPPTAEDPDAAPEGTAPETEGEVVEQESAAPAEAAPEPVHAEAAPSDPTPDAEPTASAEGGAEAPAASSSQAVAEPDEETEADVVRAEGDAPTADQAPVGGTPSDPPADDPTSAPAPDGSTDEAPAAD